MNQLEQIRENVARRIAALEARRRAVSKNDAGPCYCLEGQSPPSSAQFNFHGREAMRVASWLERSCVPSPSPRLPDLHAANLSFAARVLIAVRDKFSGDAPRVYHAAKVTRQAYSQIVSDETRPVSKRTAIRFAFALRSTPAEASALLKSAGYAFSNSLTEDFILQACLEANPPLWDLDAVNSLLAEYDVAYRY